MDRPLGLAPVVRVWRENQALHHSSYRISIALTVVHMSRLSLYLSPYKAAHAKEPCISPRLVPVRGCVPRFAGLPMGLCWSDGSMDVHHSILKPFFATIDM